MNDINSNNPYPNNAGGNFNNSGIQQNLPNATGVLVLGILSIILCWCYGVVGIILGVIALILAGSAKKAYNMNPSLYTPNSFNNVKIGRICAIIGLVLNLLFVIYIVVVIAYFGFENLQDPEKMRELIEQLQNG